MKKIPEQVIVFLGASGTGKSFLAQSLCKTAIVDQEYDPRAHGALSERSEYYIMNSPEKCIELIVAPGRRKYWKWSDYALADADSALIFVSPTDILPIASLIEPMCHLLSFDVNFAGIVINITNASPAAIDHIRNEIGSDLVRFNRSDIPIFTFSESDSESIANISKYLSGHLPVPVRRFSDPFSLSITRVHGKGSCTFVEGKILTGSLSVDDWVRVMPSGLSLRVQSICTNDLQSQARASAGQLIGICLADIDSKYIEKGMVLLTGDDGEATRSISVKLNVFNASFPINVGFSPMISVLGCHVHGRVFHMERPLFLGETGVVHIKLNKAVYVKKSLASRLSRVTLRQENVIVAVGVIVYSAKAVFNVERAKRGIYHTHTLC